MADSPALKDSTFAGLKKRRFYRASIIIRFPQNRVYRTVVLLFSA